MSSRLDPCVHGSSLMDSHPLISTSIHSNCQERYLLQNTPGRLLTGPGKVGGEPRSKIWTNRVIFGSDARWKSGHFGKKKVPFGRVGAWLVAGAESGQHYGDKKTQKPIDE